VGKNKLISRRLDQVAKNSIFLLIGLVFSNIISYVYRLIIARHFGPEQYGLFSLALMIAGFLVAFTSLGLTDGILRFIPVFNAKKQYYKSKYLIKISVNLILIINIGAGILLYLFSEIIANNLFGEPLLVVPLKMFGLLVPVWTLSNLILSFILSFERGAWHSLLNNVVPIFSRTLILIVLVLFSFGPYSIFISYIASYVILLISSIIIYKKTVKIPKIKNEVSKNEKINILKRIISYSWPLIFVALLTKIYYWTDSLMIGYYLDASEVGIYNAATPIALILTIAPTLFLQLFIPIITKEYASNRKEVVKQISQQIGKWIFIINLPIFLFIIVYPNAIINVLFGQEYISAGNALRVLSIGALISCMGMVSERLILMKGKSRIILYNVVFTSILNLVLNIYLIPKYGIIGAATSTTISWMVVSILLIIEGKKFVYILPFRRKMFDITIISLVPFLGLTMIKNIIPYSLVNLIILSISFMIIYLFIIFFTGCFDRYDIQTINTLKNKVMNIRLKNKDRN
jgi:O-antigen/teichoic acid export membrane protein